MKQKGPCRVAICVLLLLSCCSAQDSEYSQPRRVVSPLKVHVYDVPRHIFDRDQKCNKFACMFAKRLIASRYYTSDPEEAHYFWIPGPGMYQNQSILMESLNFVQMNYPYWNRSVEAGQTRHFMMIQGDHGPGDAAFDRPTHLGRPDLPLDLNPASPSRVVGFVVWNGIRDGADVGMRGCVQCFQAGKDIMMPTAHNVCGPLCGYSLQALRNSSAWRPGANIEEEINRPRDNLLFYGGSTHRGDEYTGRGPLFNLYGNQTGYELINRKAGNVKVPFNVGMKNADFCFSPLGQFGGDPDRYVPSILFGCVPVMLASNKQNPKIPHALPLEEVLPWHKFGTIIDATSMADLDAQLKCLRPHAPAMRRTMSRVWRRVLYSSIYGPSLGGSYLGEDPRSDAFQAIMAILRIRLRNNYTMPPRVRHRVVEARDSYFMCRGASGNGPKIVEA